MGLRRIPRERVKFAAVGVAVCVAVVAAGCAHRTQQPVVGGSQGIDCVSVVLSRWDTDLPVRFAALSPAARDQCLEQLLGVVADPRPSVDPAPVAGGLEDLARKGLITKASVFGPLIECLRIQHFSNWGYCNRAIEALTRHKYGHAMFAGTRGAPARTTESRDEVIGDWLQLLRPLERGRPIFDADLKRMCVDTMRAIGGGLAGALAPLLARPNQSPLYLDAFKNAPSIPNGDGEVIFEFAVGSGAGFELPANFRATEALKGIRFLLFRPGIATPSSVSQFDLRDASAARPFPVESADYREVFQALDLEFRYQVVTSSDELRRATVVAVRDALNVLREANAAYR
jgi:hypothetical protein